MFATGSLDGSTLSSLALLLSAMLLLAAFDIYGFSPRPSGLSLRSRRLAPLLVIALALLATGVSLSLGTPASLDEQVAAGANYSPRAVQAERARLLHFPLVVGNEFESLLLGLSLLGSGMVLATRFGLLGWASLIIAVALSTGLAHVLTDPSGLHLGPAELCLGLLFACLALMPLDRLQQQAPKRGELRDRWLTLTAVAMTGAAAAGELVLGQPVRLPLLLAAIAAGLLAATVLTGLKRISGPHWETTSLTFISGLGGFVLAGFTLYLSPKAFDRVHWLQKSAAVKTLVADDVQAAIDATSQSDDSLNPVDREIQFAMKLESAANLLHQSIAYAERESQQGRTLTASDLAVLDDLRLLSRMLAVLQRLHRARGAVLYAERRTLLVPGSRMVVPGELPGLDPLVDFWKGHRPWMDAELVSLRYFNSAQSQKLQPFLIALTRDLERLTQVALSVELRRVDIWIDWASRRPRSELSLMKSAATEHVERLELISSIVKLDRRFSRVQMNHWQSAERSLRRIASVPSESRW